MEQKICSRCKSPKDVDQFHFKNRSIGLRHSHCADCEAEDKKGYYLGHKGTQVAYNKARRTRLREYIWSFLVGKTCADCPEDDPIVLQFDHEEAENKILAVAEMTNQGWSQVRIKEEIEKCVIRCANCHARRTAKQFGWFDKKTAFFASR